jgi:hypothetical protein
MVGGKTMTDDNGTQGKVNRRFIVERQGREFVLYAGLLDLAHQDGLDVLETQLIQIANDENGLTYIFKATVHTKRGTFTGYAEANPSDVTRAMLTVTLRLAETRAKARALRDAVNVGMAALEELGDMAEEPHKPQPTTPHEPEPTNDNGKAAAIREVVNAPASKSPPSVPDAILATPPQVRAIYAIGRDRHNLTENEIEEKCIVLFGVKPSEISKREASDFITALNGNAKATA